MLLVGGKQIQFACVLSLDVQYNLTFDRMTALHVETTTTTKSVIWVSNEPDFEPSLF